MRKLVFVDGGFARWAGRSAGTLRGRRLGAAPEDPGLKERKLGWMHDVGLHLVGRNTYEEMAGFWPTSDDPYAAPMNEIPKVVFSSSV